MSKILHPVNSVIELSICMKYFQNPTRLRWYGADINSVHVTFSTYYDLDLKEGCRKTSSLKWITVCVKYLNNQTMEIIAAHNSVCDLDLWLWPLSHGWKFKISKILNFRKQEFKTCCMPPHYQKFQAYWSNSFRYTETLSEKLLIIYLQKSASKSWFQE